jgi:hypothetical protein
MIRRGWRHFPIITKGDFYIIADRVQALQHTRAQVEELRGRYKCGFRS